ncbi:MAG TPA: sigma-70 family RNA polymerase sigma factor [Phycisphaerales bacterium]|nr:sigma-70 family RNA polymerase sigma factor [Phycisphaerales bacterium]
MPADAEIQAADLRLMQGVAAGDPAAVALLYDRFGSLIYRMAYQSLPSRDEAEDAVQEVFVRLWRTSDRYDPTRAALVTWVMLISRRYMVDRLRRSRSAIKSSGLEEKLLDVQHGSVEASAGGNLDAEQQERFATLMKKIDQLPELQKTVVVRAYLNGQTLRQIGEELNTPLGTIKSALSRALVRLRERDVSEGLTA